MNVSEQSTHLAIWHYSVAISSELSHSLLENRRRLIKANDKVQGTRKFTRLTKAHLEIIKSSKYLTGGLSPAELT